MYRHIIFAFCFCCTASGLPGQNFARVDSFARSVDLNQLTLQQLTDSLTRRYPTDLEKVRSIFVWIAHNIAYDYEKRDITRSDTLAYLSDPLFDDKKLIENVLKRRKGICYDYSYLFRAMCMLSGVKAKLIRGYAKTDYRETGIIPFKTNHAWNAVFIDGKWKLVDVTWANEERDGVFSIRNFDEQYFLTPPSKLILNHLPEDDAWQLLEKKVDKKKFFDLPMIWSAFFRYQVQGFAPGKGLIHADNQEIEIRIKIIESEREIRLIEGNNLLMDNVPVYENGYYKFRYTTTEETTGDKLSVAIENDEGEFITVITYKLAHE